MAPQRTDDPVVRRILELLEARSWTPYELSKRANFSSTSQVAGIIRRGSDRTARDTLRKLAAGGGVNERWLLEGQGPRDLQDDGGLPVGNAPAAGRMRDRANFAGCLAAARVQRAQYRDYLWEAIADGNPMLVVPLTPALLIDLADVLVKYLPAPVESQS